MAPRLFRRLAAPLARFVELEAASGIVLLGATAIALVAANTAAADAFVGFWGQPLAIGLDETSVSASPRFIVNDGLMTIFFFVIGLEITRELTTGDLRDRRNAVLPVIGALGGAIVPVAIYLVFHSSPPERDGWGVPMATDIAFVVGCLTIFGKRIPRSLILFVLALAIVDDLLAVLIIAFALGSSIEPLWLAGAGAGFATVWVLQRLGDVRLDTLTAPVAVATAVALVVGKPLGITGAAWIAVRLRVARMPDGVSWASFVGASCLAGIGFTMALFIASLSLTGGLLDAAKTGILAGSAISAVTGLSLIALALRRERTTPEPRTVSRPRHA